MLGDDVGQGEPASGPQSARGGREDGGLVGREVDDAVGDHAVDAGVLDGRPLDVALAELALREAVLCGEVPRLRELGGGHVDADDLAVRAGGQRGEEAVGAGPAAEVEHGLTGGDRGEIEEVADAGERVDRRSGDPVEVGGRVAEPLRERPAGLEVELAVGLECDLFVHALDTLLELRGVELAGGGGHGEVLLSW